MKKIKKRFCDLDCFNCGFSDCLCPDAECVNGLNPSKYIGEIEEEYIPDEEVAEARRAYQRAWRAAHPDKVREYNRRHAKKHEQGI